MLLFDSLDTSTRPNSITDAIRVLSETSETERGAVFTRTEVVEAILDLAGYERSRPLHALRLLEPSCGHGDFLLPALSRLLDAYVYAGGRPQDAAHDLRGSLCAVEIHQTSLALTTEKVRQRLLSWGASQAIADELCRAWLRADDFLLTPLSGLFDYVVGNPPYVRIERVSPVLMAEYRRRYRTLYDRADLYVAFYERGLDLLAAEGRLAFICANRWLKNRYGGPLRERIARSFHLEHVIDLEGANAFHSEVAAYPAITVIRRTEAAIPLSALKTRVVCQPALDTSLLPRLAAALRQSDAWPEGEIHEVPSSTLSGSPWLLQGAARLELLTRLCEDYPELENAGCRVGIGVATGSDAVFIGDYQALPVEASRKLPLAMAPDLKSGQLCWSGHGVINPFEPDGKLADFGKYPRLASYLGAHVDALRARHCARKNPASWYRTIDRIWPELVGTPKLLIPDIKGESVVVLDEGHYYPHHNLYFVTSQDWDLRALQTVLRSSVALWFVASYGVKMAGGFLRFQAQYLRRIRIPPWQTVPSQLRSELIRRSGSSSLDELDPCVFALYELTSEEQDIVRTAAAAARVRTGRSGTRKAA